MKIIETAAINSIVLQQRFFRSLSTVLYGNAFCTGKIIPIRKIFLVKNAFANEMRIKNPE